MHRNFLALLISSFILLSISNIGCTKVDTTSIGSDLIPGIDNIHTFETTLVVNATQGLFNDSTRVTRAQNHVIGNINNDPLFGKTNANLFLELKPGFFPYYFGNAGDTVTGSSDVGVDSVVLCLSYQGIYGDSTKPQSFEVYQLDNNTTNFVDSAYKLNFQPNVTPTKLLGSATVDARNLDEYTYFSNHADSAHNQIRIKLSDAFKNELFGRDSTTGNTLNNAFRSDSIFKTFYKGFEVKATSTTSNSLFYVNLTDATTRLEVHYRKRNKGNVDTTFASFPFSYLSSTNVSLSSHANYLNRDRTGSESTTSPDADALYIQATPGSYATLKIPELTGFPNSIVHRAELIVEQVPSDPVLDKILISPSYLYVDLIDPTTGTGFKPIYYDLSPTTAYNPDNSTSGYFLPASGIDFSYFGGFAKTKLDYLGKSISYYNFNLSRYIQNTITKQTTNYDLRLYAPINLDYYGYIYPYNNSLAYGRVKIGAGNNPNYKLRLHIVYSKI